MKEGDRVRVKAEGRDGTIRRIAERSSRTFYYVEFDTAVEPRALGDTNPPLPGKFCVAEELELLS